MYTYIYTCVYVYNIYLIWYFYDGDSVLAESSGNLEYLNNTLIFQKIEWCQHLAHKKCTCRALSSVSMRPTKNFDIRSDWHAKLMSKFILKCCPVWVISLLFKTWAVKVQYWRTISISRIVSKLSRRSSKFYIKIAYAKSYWLDDSCEHIDHAEDVFWMPFNRNCLISENKKKYSIITIEQVATLNLNFLNEFFIVTRALLRRQQHTHQHSHPQTRVCTRLFVISWENNAVFTSGLS